MALSEKHVLMSLSPNRATPEVGWHRRAGAYEDPYIDNIEDPSNAIMSRILTAIPSPFARLHLFDAAFGFVSRAVGGKPQHSGSTDFHQMVSDCLDVLELLYSIEDHATKITISRWMPANNLSSLESSREYGQKLLASTLKLYLQEDGTANFHLQPVFYQLIVQHEIIAVSSPLTLFITAPEARDTASAHALMNTETQKPYFSVIRPLHERRDDFQLYLHDLFGRRPTNESSLLSSLCRRMHTYLDKSEELVRLNNPELAKKIRELRHQGTNGNATTLTPLLDDLNEPITILGTPLWKRSSRVLPRLKDSLIALRSTRLKPGMIAPIVWTGSTDSFGASRPYEELSTDLPSLEERVLPDLRVKYPFLCANDLIEDRIVRVPFAMNSKQFCVPKYEGFEPGIEFSYLLPLKKAFFDYFDPKAISSMATFRRVSEGVSFELAIPTQGKALTFQKTFFDSPQQSKYGKIISASMNCALYPFLSIKDHPKLSDRYWVMLVDAERDPAMRARPCFDFRFYRTSPATVTAFVEGQAGAPLTVTTSRRSDKLVDAGSTFYELNGGRCDFIQVESFSFEAERKAIGTIVPNWEDRPLGTRKARVAIDFGTTNTHMAWRFEEDQPASFQIDSSDLQIALLNAPDLSRAVEGQKFDAFPGRLVGTAIRLHHEFLPSIIGAGSRFNFPMRTATSEQPNLQFGDFHTLRTINISFIYGLDAPRPEERVVTDLKWSLEAAPEVEQRVKAFIEELLYLMRTKLLMHDVDPSKLVLTWFRPLSFNHYTRNQFEKIWKEKAQRVIGMSPERVTSLTESEAPYYYHHEAGMITSKPTMCVDIGGGSTDVVFFDGHQPRFGTSFSFAGNALWGTGYDKLGLNESGVVRNLSEEIQKRMDANPTQDESSTIKKAYAALIKSKASSQEIMNFCFGVDSHIHITDALSKNSAVKCLALIHYSAIIYHCAQLMKTQEMVAPEYICFSGRGSQYLNILDVTPNKDTIAVLTQSIVEHVFGARLQERVRLRFAVQSKEATCNGGLLKRLNLSHDGIIQEDPTPNPLVALGDGAIASSKPLTYGDLDHEMKSRVVANMENFIDMLLMLSTKPEINFKNYFGITFPATEVRQTLNQKIEESIDYVLNRNYMTKPEEELSETLFFYPLVSNLYELGNKLL
jgi:hypothetical protein